MNKTLSTLALILTTLLSPTSQAQTAYENTEKWWGNYVKKREDIYSKMRQYGISRQYVEAMRSLEETAPPHSVPHIKIRTDKLLSPGEHYRMEVDEFSITMRIPNAPISSSWIWPYTNTRTPDLKMIKLLSDEKGRLPLANLGWLTCQNIFLERFFGECERAGMGISYRILQPHEQPEFSTPEMLQQLSQRILRNMIIPAEKIEDAIRSGKILNGSDNKIYLDSEIIVINGRIWIRDAMDSDSDRIFYYKTRLSKDRMLGLSFGLPTYNYNANPEPSNHPTAIKRAAALMEELISSLRIARVDDDNTPDPFVIERVAPAPLPVREALPSNQ